jgi:hypothetical protein
MLAVDWVRFFVDMFRLILKPDCFGKPPVQVTKTLGSQFWISYANAMSLKMAKLFSQKRTRKMWFWDLMKKFFSTRISFFSQQMKICSGRSKICSKATKKPESRSFQIQGCQMLHTFTYQNYQFGYILEGLGMENVCMYLGHLEYLTVIWYILWP